MAGMMCIVAGLMVSLSVPNGSINKIYSFLRRILLVQDGPEYAKSANNYPSRTTLGSFWGHFGIGLGICGGLWVTRWSLHNHCGVTLGI